MSKNFLLIILILTLMVLEGVGVFYFATKSFRASFVPTPSTTLSPTVVPSEESLVIRKSPLFTQVIFFLDYTGNLKEKGDEIWVLEEDGEQATFTIGEETRFYAFDENLEKLKIEREEIKVGDRVAIMVRTVGFDVAEKISKGDLTDLTVTEVDLIKTKEE